MLDATPAKHSRTVKALTNPRPSKVSLVKAGSNMTPILAIKADLQPVAQQQEAQAMSTTRPYDVARITFDKTVYKDDSAVTKWLAAGGYQDFAIKDDGTVFTVMGAADIGKEIATDTTLPIADGVTVFAVKKAEVAQTVTLADVQPDLVLVPSTGAPKSELAVKFDSWYARYADSTTLKDAVLAGTYDGLPPGSDDVMGAARSVIGNCAQSGDTAGVKQACSDLGDFLVSLIGLFGVQSDNAVAVKSDAADGSAPVVGKLIEDVLSSGSAPVADAAPVVAPVVDPVVAPVAEPTVEPVVTPAAVPAVPAADPEVVAEPAVVAPVVDPAVVAPAAEPAPVPAQGSIEALTALVSTLAVSVTDLVKAQSEQKQVTQAAIGTAVAEATQKSEAKIAALTTQVEEVVAPRARQTLKGADVTEISPAKQNAPATAQPAQKSDRLARNALGFR